jgi:hypothetical protein
MFENATEIASFIQIYTTIVILAGCAGIVFTESWKGRTITA